MRIVILQVNPRKRSFISSTLSKMLYPPTSLSNEEISLVGVVLGSGRERGVGVHYPS
jgi:hypothetical protein